MKAEDILQVINNHDTELDIFCDDNREAEYKSAYDFAYSYLKDEEEAKQWFHIVNPMLGNITPQEYINSGKYRELLNQLKEYLK